MVTVELTQEEAEALRTLGFFHIASSTTNPGYVFVTVANKLEAQGVSARNMQWHVNEFGNIVIDSIN